jgi:transposase
MEKGKSVFTAEFKREALRLVESSGKPLAQVARELGISDNTLYGWKQQMREHGKASLPRQRTSNTTGRRNASVTTRK